MELIDLYLLMLFLFFTGIVSVFISKTNEKLINYIAHSMAALGCLAAILCAIFVFHKGSQHVFSLPFFPSFGPMTADIDYLSAYFLFIIGLVGVIISIYAYSYGSEYYGKRLPEMSAFFNAFLLSMVLVVTLSNIIGFLIAWELMAIASYFLVNHNYEKPNNRRAAYIYIVMTHVGTAFIIIGFLLLASYSGSMEFSKLTGINVSPFVRNVIFLCALVGFGTKAGMVPLHVWLPRAHPVAPSHVSALMSGVMLKTAIYGMCRFFIYFLGVGPMWWGGLILLLATVSAVLGVLYALVESDFKKLLAYSSVENMGIILFGMGAGMVFTSQGQTVLAGLAWIAALYHVFNHAIFKSLLFMVSGSMQYSVHTMNLEKMGGLIKKMPYTAVFFLIGIGSISALPSLNGFISEWLTFQTLIFLPQAFYGLFGKVASALLIASLGLTGALAVACFIKSFGISFLAKSRSKNANSAVEVPIPMLISMGCMAIICIVAGVFPQMMLRVLQEVYSNISGVDMRNLFSYNGYLITFKAEEHYGVLSVPVVLVLLVIGLSIAFYLPKIFAKTENQRGETWTCGIIPGAKMEYTAIGFSKPIRLAFRSILRPQHDIIVQKGSNEYFGRTLTYSVGIRYVFSEMVYRPANRYIVNSAKFMRTIQAGSLQLYIGYILVVTIFVLIWSTRW